MESLEEQSQQARHGDLSLKSGPRAAMDEPPLLYRVWFWGCCTCGLHASMSEFIDHCPGCQHERCHYCPLEFAKIHGEELCPTSATSTNKFVSGSYSTPIESNLPFTQRSRKHSLNYGDRNQGGKGQDFKKLREDATGSRDGVSSTGGSQRYPPNFACHFYKLNWKKYSPWADQKYEKCTGSRITELRRIKSVPNLTQSIA